MRVAPTSEAGDADILFLVSEYEGIPLDCLPRYDDDDNTPLLLFELNCNAFKEYYFVVMICGNIMLVLLILKIDSTYLI